ncbi:MAG TPA: hypothetical protein PLU81_06340 [Deltaproteobacteria bacterium]|nr:hypothetical protein [Deltaproteobacteria bacterium]HPJ95423.1 hypothetical protein [Deltaproteobacteria bacterium]HPR51388.1 hypothetical protein [Deltaproteobacteria bacterium]
MAISSRIPTQQDIQLAEKHVFAGIYALLLKRYTSSYNRESAPRLALAVTNELFCLPPLDETAQSFLKKNHELILHEIKALQSDEQIRRVVTDALVIKAVFQHRQNGCGKDDAGRPIEKLKELGLFLEGEKPPTPLSFVQMAWDFYAEASGKQDQ